MNKLLLLLLIGALMAALFAFDLDRWLTLEALKAGQATFATWQAAAPLWVAGGYFLLYVLVTALSVPGAVVMTLAGGALFGLGLGTLLVSFASSLGATLAFLTARFLMRDWVRQRFGARLGAIDAGMAQDGPFYLFTLRLVPVFPFFVINLVMGLTPIRTWSYYWVSQLGMLPATLVYVNAGTQLAHLDSLAGLLSPTLVASFALLGLFPWLAKGLLALPRGRQVYKGWRKPARFDRNLVVIGAGAGGLVSAYIAAAVKARVTLVEQHRMGGDCLNTGCVPSKALIRSARLVAQMGDAHRLGIRAARPEVEFAALMERVRQVVKTVEPHDSVERYQGLGVEVLQGRARLVSPWEVEIKGPEGTLRRLTSRAIILATGARPLVPPIPGIEEVGHVTSDTLWELTELPRRLLVLGGGPIGAELAQAFARLGARVTLVERLPRLLMREDPEVAALVMERFQAEGIQVRVDHQAQRFLMDRGERCLIAEHAGAEIRIPFDRLLVAVGRVANLKGYGLEELGIAVDGARLETNPYLQTRYPNIHAVGDLTGPYQFTHVAAHQAWYAAVNALFSGFRRFKVDYRVIPTVTFTSPEVARVGLSETEARQRGIPHEVTRYGLDDLDRAIADGAAHGFVKVLTPPGKDRILGVGIVGEHAGELLAEFTLAMRHGLGLNKILATVHPYPTWSEAARYAAGEWKRAHAPRGLLTLLERFHDWRRG